MGVNLSERMQYLRKNKSATMEQIADVAGVTQAAVSQWCNGKTNNIKAQVALKLAEYFNVNYHWLSDGEGDPEDFNEKPNYAKIISYARKTVVNGDWEWDDETDALYLDKNFLINNSISIPKCVFLKAWDNSMEPSISKSDYLIIELIENLHPASVEKGKVYIFTFDGQYYIRRLYPRLNGDIVIVCDNHKFGEDKIQESDTKYIKIIGQVKAKLGVASFI